MCGNLQCSVSSISLLRAGARRTSSASMSVGHPVAIAACESDAKAAQKTRRRSVWSPVSAQLFR